MDVQDIANLVQEIQASEEYKRVESGFLYTALQKIIDSLNNERSIGGDTLAVHKEICEIYDINESRQLDEDCLFSVQFIFHLVMIFFDIIGIKIPNINFPSFSVPMIEVPSFSIEKLMEDLMSGIKNNFNNLVTKISTPEMKISLIILVALLIVILYRSGIINKKIKKDSNLKEKARVKDERSIVPSETKVSQIPASICLIVYARDVANLTVGQIISVDEVKKYIEGASYYRVIRDELVDNLEKKLSISNKPILKDSVNDTYLRIKVSDGKEIIGKSPKFAIYGNLNASSKYTIAYLSCLDNLNGVEEFIRA
ncbi:hypothetical protein [Thermosynechococcus sp. FA-CM-4201]